MYPYAVEGGEDGHRELHGELGLEAQAVGLTHVVDEAQGEHHAAAQQDQAQVAQRPGGERGIKAHGHQRNGERREYGRPAEQRRRRFVGLYVGGLVQMAEPYRQHTQQRRQPERQQQRQDESQQIETEITQQITHIVLL